MERARRHYFCLVSIVAAAIFVCGCAHASAALPPASQPAPAVSGTWNTESVKRYDAAITRAVKCLVATPDLTGVGPAADGAAEWPARCAITLLEAGVAADDPHVAAARKAADEAGYRGSNGLLRRGYIAALAHDRDAAAWLRKDLDDAPGELVRLRPVHWSYDGVTLCRVATAIRAARENGVALPSWYAANERTNVLAIDWDSILSSTHVPQSQQLAMSAAAVAALSQIHQPASTRAATRPTATQQSASDTSDENAELADARAAHARLFGVASANLRGTYDPYDDADLLDAMAESELSTHGDMGIPSGRLKQEADLIVDGQSNDGSFSVVDKLLIEKKQLTTSAAIRLLAVARMPVAMNALRRGTAGEMARHGAANVEDAERLTRAMSRDLACPLRYCTASLDDSDALARSPILYLAGDDALPANSAEQLRLISYLLSGGTIVGSAGNASQAFAESFKKIGLELFRSLHLTFRKLPADHPLFQSPLRLAAPPEVWGMSDGTRELMLLFPNGAANEGADDAKAPSGPAEVMANLLASSLGDALRPPTIELPPIVATTRPAYASTAPSIATTAPALPPALKLSTARLKPRTVQAAIDAASDYLSAMQQNGNWEPPPNRPLNALEPGQITAEVALALRSNNEPHDGKVLAAAIKYLVDNTTDTPRAAAARSALWSTLPKPGANEPDWLAASRHDAQIVLEATNGPGLVLRGSEVMIAAIEALNHANFEAPDAFYSRIADHCRQTQAESGCWLPPPQLPRENITTFRETANALATLLAVDAHQAQLDRAIDDVPFNVGMKWLEQHASDLVSPLTSGVPRSVLRLGLQSGRRRFGAIDWYTLVGQRLLAVQKPDGSIPLGGPSPALDTAEALQFLARGREPVMLSKLDYDFGAPRRAMQRPNDAANIADYCSRQMGRGLQARVVRFGEEIDWDDSPILYLSGAGEVQFTDEQKAALKRYIENGGLLIANAERHDPVFIHSMRALGEKLFPSYEFRTLPSDHPFLKGSIPRRPAQKIFGISNGVRELMIILPEDSGRFWQTYSLDGLHEQFNFMLNILLQRSDDGKHFERPASVPRD